MWSSSQRCRYLLQAFGLPILQIVHETIRMRQRDGGTVTAAPSTSGQKVACCLNVDDRDLIVAISEDGLRAQSRSQKAWGGARATVGAFAGQMYYEV